MSSALRPINNGKFGLWGYCSPEDPVEMVIPARYERAEVFSEGLAAVRLNGLWGYTDDQGQIQIPATFEKAGPFHNGLAEVVVGDGAGVIDRSGSFIIKPTLGRAMPWTEDVVLGQEKQSSILPSRNKDLGVLNAIYDVSGDSRSVELRFGLLSTGGDWLFPQVLSRGLAVSLDKIQRLWVVEGPGGKFGMIAPNGTWVVQPLFSEVRVTRNGMAVVNAGTRAEPQYGVMSIRGTWVVEPGQYSLILPSRDCVRVFKDKQKGLIDENGKLIGNRLFDRLDVYDTEGIYLVTADGNTQALTRSGELIADPRVGQVIKECPNGLRLVSNGDKRRILTATGAATVPYEVDIWQMHCDRPTTIKIGDKWTFLFTSGRLMHEPPRFEKLSSFKDGYACVSECGVWGLIDETGRYVIEPHYEYLSPMVFDQTLADLALRCVVEQPKGLFKVHHHGQTFAVDCNGVESELPQRPLRKLDRVPLPNGTCLMHEHGSWGIADEDGSIIIPPVYRAVDTFRDGVAWIAMDDRKLWMPIGPDGKQRSCLTAPRTAHCPVRSFDTEPKTLHEDPYESSVLWARWWLEALAEHRADAPPFGSP